MSGIELRSWPRPCPRPRLGPRPFPRLAWWVYTSFTSGSGSDPVGRFSWFFNNKSLFYSATRRWEISSEYFLKSFSRYCCCKSTFEAWKVENVFSIISISLIVFPHNFNWEVILNMAELYSCIDLKSCSLRCIQSYRAFGCMTIFKWSNLSFRFFHKTSGSLTVRYSIFRISSRWWRKNIIARAQFWFDALVYSFMVSPRPIASRWISFQYPWEVVPARTLKGSEL